MCIFIGRRALLIVEVSLRDSFFNGEFSFSPKGGGGEGVETCVKDKIVCDIHGIGEN